MADCARNVIVRCLLILVALVGVAPAAFAQYAPGSIVPFGQQAIGTRGTEVIVAVVPGGGTEATDFVIVGADFQFGPSTTCPTQVPGTVSTSCIVTVVFAPAGTGAHTGQLIQELFLCTLPCIPNPTWTLTGTGINSQAPGVSTVAFSFNDLSGDGQTTVGNDFVFDFGGVAALDDTYNSPTGSSLQASGHVTATIGTLSVRSSASFAVPSGNAIAVSYAEGRYSDELTFTDDNHPNGSVGFVTLYYSLDGVVTQSGNGKAIVQVAAQATDPVTGLVPFSAQAFTSSTTGTFALPRAFRVIFGQPVVISFCLGASTGWERGVLDSGH